MKLSIIVPVYNGGKYLERCIKSVKKALSDIEGEILIIDNGSTDNTGEICHRLEESFDDVKSYRLSESGVSFARNFGMSRASGEYMAFVDADDVVRPDMFVKLLRVAEKTGCDMSGCRFYIWSDEKDIRECPSEEDEYKVYSKEEYIKNQILKGNTRCWSKIYRADLLSKVRFKDGLTVGEDMLFMTQAALLSSGLAEFEEYDGYGYFRNENGAINRPFTPEYMDQIKCWELMKEELSDTGKENGYVLNERLLTACMLTASKIARLPKRERKRCAEYINICHEKIKELSKEDLSLLKRIDRGYRIKTRIFEAFPAMYITLYHLWKR